MRPADWLDIAAELERRRQAGGAVHAKLVESGAAIQLTHKLAAQDDWLVEAGDLGAIRARGGRPFGRPAPERLPRRHPALAGQPGRLPLCRPLGSIATNWPPCWRKPPGLPCEVMVWGGCRWRFRRAALPLGTLT